MDDWTRLLRSRGRPSRPRRPSSTARLLSRGALPAVAGSVLVGVVGLVLLGASPTSAHAFLKSSTPAADSVLATPPTSVELVFSEAVTLLPEAVRVFGPDGGRVDEGAVAHADGDSATAAVRLGGDLSVGTYRVSYRVVSEDSHPIEGAFTFAVGHSSRGHAVLPGADGGSRSVAIGLGLSRWLGYAGAALGLGGFAFLVWCWPAGWAVRRARFVVSAGVGGLVAGTLLGLLLKGPYDAGLGLGHVSEGDLLREVLGTRYGEALDARLVLIALLVLLLAYREDVPARVLLWAPAVLLVGVGLTFALGGHAAAGDHRALAVASDTVHVAAMSVWLGGLVLLIGAVLLRGRREEAMSPVLRFSTLASGSVTMLIVTGLYQTLREVRSWDALLHTHYGHVLVVKLGIVALAFLAAAGSRTWVWQSVNPVLPVRAATSVEVEPAGDGRPTLRRLRLSVGLETLLLIGVLVVSAMLVTSDPAPSSAPTQPVVSTPAVDPARIRVAMVPDGTHRISLTLDVTHPPASRPNRGRSTRRSASAPS